MPQTTLRVGEKSPRSWSVVILLLLMGSVSLGLAVIGGRAIRPSIEALIALPQAAMVWRGGHPGLVDHRSEPMSIADGDTYRRHRLVRDGGLVTVFGAVLLACWCAYRLALIGLGVDQPRDGSGPTAPVRPAAGAPAGLPPPA